MDLAISDILATPGLKLQDVRLILAEAQGRKIPVDDYTEFVRFAKGIGLAHQQAYEAARRWVRRPSDGPLKPGGGSLTPVVTRNPEAMSSRAGHSLADLLKK